MVLAQLLAGTQARTDLQNLHESINVITSFSISLWLKAQKRHQQLPDLRRDCVLKSAGAVLPLFVPVLAMLTSGDP